MRTASLSLEFRDVPAYDVPKPPVVRPWDTSDVAFADVVSTESGIVTFGFKEPGSPRVQETGVGAAVSKETIIAGTELLILNGATVIHRLGSIGAVVVPMEAADAVRLRRHELVDYAEPRRWGRIDGARLPERVPRAAQGGETLPWGIIMVRAPQAWDAGGTGFGAKVLIIDTGYDHGHEDLPAIWSNHCGGTFGGCNDGHGHGTHVTGIVSALDNSIGVIGGARLIQPASGLHVWGACDNTGDCPTDEVAAGVDAGIYWGVQVINLSLSYYDLEYTTDLANVVAAAVDTGIVVIASAGNNDDNVLKYPAADPGVVGVSGVRSNYEFASSSPCPRFDGSERSNYGDHVDIAAPFWALSTAPNDTYEDENDGRCGNSQAVPHVTGAVAALRGEYPELSRSQIENSLWVTADDRGPAGWDDHYGHGILDIEAALAHAATLSPEFPGTITIDGPSSVPPDNYCEYEAVVTGGSPPYTIEWYKDGGFLGTGTEMMVYTGVSNFTLRVDVTDDTGAEGSKLKGVQNDGMTECFQ